MGYTGVTRDGVIRKTQLTGTPSTCFYEVQRANNGSNMYSAVFYSELEGGNFFMVKFIYYHVCSPLVKCYAFRYPKRLPKNNNQSFFSEKNWINNGGRIEKWVLPMAENGAGGDHTTAYLQLQGRPTHEII